MKISLLSIKFSQNKLRLHPGTTTFPVIESLSRTLSFDMSIRMVVLCCSYQASTASWHEVSWGTELYDMYRFSPALAFGSCCRDPILARWFAQCWALRARSSSHVSGDALCRARLVLWASRHALESTSNHVCKNILKNYWIKGKKNWIKGKKSIKVKPKIKESNQDKMLSNPFTRFKWKKRYLIIFMVKPYVFRNDNINKQNIKEIWSVWTKMAQKVKVSIWIYRSTAQ